jgi:predicted SnoaL-like aldol condensation-catalyzing enzyme
MSLEQNKVTARRFVEELLAKGNFQLFDELTSPTYIDHNLPPGVTPQQGIGALHAGFPDTRFTVEDIIAEGDKVVVRYTITGTHTGNFIGFPETGKPIIMTGISIYRIINGKLVESWVQYDQLGLMQQIGVVPMPAPQPG